MLRPLINRLLLLEAAGALLVSGCDDVFTPSVANVAGDYTATTFTTTTDGATTDQLARGASLVLQLAPDRTVAGRLFVPNGAEGGGDFDETMAGTWTVTGDVVTFDQEADTFVRDMSFTASPRRLRGEAAFPSGVMIRVVLAK